MIGKHLKREIDRKIERDGHVESKIVRGKERKERVGESEIV